MARERSAVLKEVYMKIAMLLARTAPGSTALVPGVLKSGATTSNS